MQASQRLTTFNFYIALSSLLSGGMAASFNTNIKIPYLGLLLGSMLILFSLIFWKLDNRNRDLIRSAEETLKYFERQAPIEDDDGMPHIAKRFLREEFDTNVKMATNSWRFWRNYYTYTFSFQIVFLTFAIFGILGSTFSILLVAKKI